MMAFAGTSRAHSAVERLRLSQAAEGATNVSERGSSSGLDHRPDQSESVGSPPHDDPLPQPETEPSFDHLPGNEDPPTIPSQVAAPRKAVPLGELERPPADDPNELLKHRFLCRGGAMLLCGPTGIGKSALALQAAMLWSLGRRCLGVSPSRPLTSLIIQAENDDGDLAEMRDGVAAGLNLSPEEREIAFSRVLIVHECTRTSTAFFHETVRPLLETHRPDLLWIDPALAYIGGDASAQQAVGGFLRNGLAPLLAEFGCGAIILHHVNKPPSSAKERPDWAAGDFAYAGSGSAEFANWCRAVFTIRSLGSHNVFELRAGKRGGRLRWNSTDGSPLYHRNIAHAREPGLICWREADAEEAPKPSGRPKTAPSDEEVLALLAPKALRTKDWEKLARSELGVPRSTFFGIKKALLADARIYESPIDGWHIKQNTAKNPS